MSPTEIRRQCPTVKSGRSPGARSGSHGASDRSKHLGAASYFAEPPVRRALPRATQPEPPPQQTGALGLALAELPPLPGLDGGDDGCTIMPRASWARTPQADLLDQPLFAQVTVHSANPDGVPPHGVGLLSREEPKLSLCVAGLVKALLSPTPITYPDAFSPSSARFRLEGPLHGVNPSKNTPCDAMMRASAPSSRPRKKAA